MTKSKGKTKRYKKPSNYAFMRFSGVFNVQTSDEGDGVVHSVIRTKSLINAYEADPASTNPTQEPLINQQFIKKMWDEYRVKKVHLHYVPNFNYGSNGIPDSIVPPCVIFHDTDSVKSLSVSQCLANETSKLRDMTRPWKLSYSIPIYNGNVASTNGWQNCQSDTAGSTTFSAGIIAINGTAANVPPTKNYKIGTIFVRYDVEFKGRQDETA
jgi:hypothetical protein